ncbi:dynein regulatory complex subunit 2-like [Aricia agestis]|uniref:dynein regulatory complex subunit 2-like n=1 Tax=Aricia agestis TaxID=91739 RepID=UPI001C209FC2|nr:dynein regulatory complex subunit 2-like [Aricia agestis]
MGLSLKQIRQQAMNLSNAKGGNREKVLIRTKIQEVNREIEIHARIKDELAEFFKEKVSKIKEPVLRPLEAVAEENKNILNKRFRREEHFNENISMSQKLADAHLQILIYDANYKAESQKCTQRGIHSMTEQDKRKRNANKRGIVHQYFLKAFLDMRNEYRSIFRSYVNNTTDINKEVRKLREKDKVLAGIIAAQAVQLQQSDGMIKQLRSDLQAIESIQRTELHDRINNYRDACKRLKVILSEVRKSDDKQIKFLVSESNAAIDWLKSTRKKGEAILKLAALSRKYETLREKVIPFANELPTEDLTQELEEPIKYTLTKNIFTNNCGLTRLWQRISNAKLSYKALNHEKLLLEYENTILTQKVKENLSNKCVNNLIVTLDGVLEVQKYIIQYNTN